MIGNNDFKNKKVPEDWYIQSGVIPYRFKNNNLQILLITSRKNKKWIIPKGIVEAGLMPQESAAKEALEEAGVLGVVENDSLGKYKVKKWGGKIKVKVFPMKVISVLDDYEEKEFRKRKWLEFNEAVELIELKKMKKLLSRLKERVL